MRPVDLLATLGPTETIEDYCARLFAEISEASKETPAIFAAEAITLENFDEVDDILTDFDVANATLDQLRQIVATLIFYIQKRGPERTQ